MLYELWRACRMSGRYKYVEAFIMSPKLNLAMVEVRKIGHAILLLEALGEGTLLVSTRKRPPSGGCYSMASCSIDELSGKSVEEIYAILDRRTDKVLEKERSRINNNS